MHCQTTAFDFSLQKEHDMEAKNYSLESSVSVWSDFLRLHFHPRSLLLLPDYYHKE